MPTASMTRMLALPSDASMLSCCPTLRRAVRITGRCDGDVAADCTAGTRASTFTVPSDTPTTTRSPVPNVESGAHGYYGRGAGLDDEGTRRILRDAKESLAALERDFARVIGQRRPQHRLCADCDERPVAQQQVAFARGRFDDGHDRLRELHGPDDWQDRQCRQSCDDAGRETGRQPGTAAPGGGRPSLAAAMTALRRHSLPPGGDRNGTVGKRRSRSPHRRATKRVPSLIDQSRPVAWMRSRPSDALRSRPATSATERSVPPECRRSTDRGTTARPLAARGRALPHLRRFG